MEGDQLDQGMPPPALTQDIPPMKKVKKQYPQKTIDQFWEKFVTKFPGKVETILPSNIYAKSRAAKTHEGVVHGQAATKSYDEARAECVEAVNKISTECRRVNMKYRDPHFDIDFDLKWNTRNCLDGLTVDRWDVAGLAPKSVKRVPVGTAYHFCIFRMLTGLPRRSLTNQSSTTTGLQQATSAKVPTVTVGSCRRYALWPTKST